MPKTCVKGIFIIWDYENPDNGFIIYFCMRILRWDFIFLLIFKINIQNALSLLFWEKFMNFVKNG